MWHYRPGVERPGAAERLRRWSNSAREKDRQDALRQGWRVWLIASFFVGCVGYAILGLLAALGYDVGPFLPVPLIVIVGTASNRIHHRRRSGRSSLDDSHDRDGVPTDRQR